MDIKKRKKFDTYYPDSTFDAVRGYTTLDKKGNPKYDIVKRGGKVIFTNRKTGKVTSYTYKELQKTILNKGRNKTYN